MVMKFTISKKKTAKHVVFFSFLSDVCFLFHIECLGNSQCSSIKYAKVCQKNDLNLLFKKQLKLTLKKKRKNYIFMLKKLFI